MKHDCCEKDSKKVKNKKGVDSFLVGIVIVTVLLLGGAIYFGSKIGSTAQISADTQVETQIGESRYDWGTIDISNGIVSKSFAIENKGETPLKIYDVKTSCTCTTAQLKVNGRNSKKFSMHEKGSSVFEVNPGETAELLVEFDPAFHGPNGVGPINRTITMNTNDANNQTLSFQLTGTVIKK